MTKPERIPLFPLPVVLLPGTPLPLHIFEPRYKTMIRRCMAEQIEFGLLLSTSDGLAETGCTAAVIKLLREHPDGKMDILTEGRSAFRLKQLIEENEYYEGNVEYLVDASNVWHPEQETKLLDVFGQCHLLLYEETWSDKPSAGPDGLAYRIAGCLPMNNDDKQTLLETRSENHRRTFMLQWLTELLPVLVSRQKARRTATGNGHGPN
jgi:Lon protease-like protein